MKDRETIITYFQLNEKELCIHSSFSSTSEILNSKRFAIGRSHFVLLEDNGKVTAFGDNLYGQLWVGQWDRAGVIKVAAGDCHTVGLKRDGTVLAVGDNRCGQCDVGDWTDAVDIYAEGNRTVGIKKDGTLLVTGSNPMPDQKKDPPQNKQDQKPSPQTEKLTKEELIKRINRFAEFYIKFALKQMGKSGVFYVHRLELLDEAVLNELYRDLVQKYIPLEGEKPLMNTAKKNS